jgi:hypothetical protein
MTKLELLYAQKSEKFCEVCAVAARELGYGELSTLSVEDRIRVEDEAKLYVEQWEETMEMRTNFTVRPVTPLTHLLAEYHDICERLLDEHEIVACLLAYRKEPRNADAQRPLKKSRLRSAPFLSSRPPMSGRVDALRVEVLEDEIIVILPATSYGVVYYKPANAPQLLVKNFLSKNDSGAPMTF